MNKKFNRMVYWWDYQASNKYDFTLRRTSYAKFVDEMVRHDNYISLEKIESLSMIEKEAELKRYYGYMMTCPHQTDFDSLTFAIAEPAKEAAIDYMNSDASEYDNFYAHVGDTVDLAKFDYHLSKEEQA